MNYVHPPIMNIERMLRLSGRLVRLQTLIAEEMQMKKKATAAKQERPKAKKKKTTHKKVGKRLPVETDLRAGVEWTDVWTNVQKATEMIAEDVADAAKAAPNSLNSTSPSA